jgi:hypothetical protein
MLFASLYQFHEVKFVHIDVYVFPEHIIKLLKLAFTITRFV